MKALKQVCALKQQGTDGSRSFPGDSVVENLPANAGDRGLIPGSG